MEFTKTLLEELTARGDGSIPAQLKQEWKAMAALVVALSFVLETRPFHHNLETFISQGFGLLEGVVKFVVALVIDAKETLSIVGAMLEDYVIGTQLPRQTCQRKDLILHVRSRDHLHVDIQRQIVPLLNRDRILDILDDLIEIA